MMHDRYTYRGQAKKNGSAFWAYGGLLRGQYAWGIGSQDAGWTVNPATVGLCAALPDKNGEVIFEGDILEERSDTGTHRLLVKYGPYQHIDAQREYTCGDVGFYCEAISPEGGHLRNDIQFWAARSVRIGNRWDNPELLEGGTEIG